jgi:DNA helicase-2/ATP-dependent DNA helicase PcrA
MARYTHVFIDEYQDAGSTQHDLFLKLKELGLVAVSVGDADQAIFGYSGRDPQLLLDLAKREDFKAFTVDRNHRCHPSIINYSMRLLNETASLMKTDDCRVFMKSCSGDQAAIAQWIDRCLPEMMESYEVAKNSDVGVLVTNGITGGLVDISLQMKHRFFKNHPLEDHFTLWSGLFCDLLAYRFDPSVTAQDIIDAAPSNLSRSEVRTIRREIKTVRQVKQEDLFELFVGLASVLVPNGYSEESIELLKVSLLNDLASSFTPARDEEVQVMTLHKAKGLEFDLVFHLDLYEWGFPAKAPGPNNDFDHPIYRSLDQDVNLHYVGVTRAKKVCFLCTSTQRTKKKWQAEELEAKRGNPSEFFARHGLGELREDSQV